MHPIVKELKETNSAIEIKSVNNPLVSQSKVIATTIKKVENKVGYGFLRIATIANGYVCQILVCEWLYNVAFGLRKFSQRNSHLR